MVVKIDKSILSPPGGSSLRDFHKQVVLYLKENFEQSEAIQARILKWIESNSDSLLKEDIKEVLNFSIENAKLLYSTAALLDRLIRTSENEQ